jgi:hypothetical protein
MAKFKTVRVQIANTRNFQMSSFACGNPNLPYFISDYFIDVVEFLVVWRLGHLSGWTSPYSASGRNKLHSFFITVLIKNNNINYQKVTYLRTYLLKISKASPDRHHRNVLEI